MPFDGTIMALDVSSVATAMCFGKPGERPVFLHERLKREDDTTREAWGRATLWANKQVMFFKPDRLIIEAGIARLGGKSNIGTIILLQQLIGIIGGIAQARGVMPVPPKGEDYQVAVSTVRARFLGNGRMSGEDAKPAAMRLCVALGWGPKTYDESDAGAVWYWACHQMRPDLVPPVAHLHAAIAAKQPIPARLERVTEPASQEAEF